MCLRKLEEGNFIKRYKKGRSIVYSHHWNTPPRGDIELVWFHPMETTTPPHGEIPLHQVEPNKNKEKEQTIREEILSNCGLKDLRKI